MKEKGLATVEKFFMFTVIASTDENYHVFRELLRGGLEVLYSQGILKADAVLKIIDSADYAYFKEG